MEELRSTMRKLNQDIRRSGRISNQILPGYVSKALLLRLQFRLFFVFFFYPCVPLFERAKTVHALDRVATVIAGLWYCRDYATVNSYSHRIKYKFSLMILY
jgi:hypothetical protein